MSNENVTMVTKRTPEEIAAIEEEHGHIMMYTEGFSLLLSPMGALWVDKRHPEYQSIIEQCIIYCKMFGDKDKIAEYEKLLEDHKRLQETNKQ